jgi:hypothetical protein
MENLTFAVATIDASPAETEALWALHWEETEVQYRKAPMNHNWTQFAEYEKAGQALYFTARLDGKLVGHLYYFVYTDRHTQTLHAVEDFFFMTPEVRKGFNAAKFIRFAVTVLKGVGCLEIGMSSKLTGRDIAPLLKRAGFRHVANYYTLR